MTTALDQAKAVADAVLYEGYLLYPYRASAAKNQVRWQFGVLMPPAFADADAGEHTDSRTECLLEPGPNAMLRLQVRFLRVQARTVWERDAAGDYHQVPSLTVDGREQTTWDEAIEHESTSAVPVALLLERDIEMAGHLAAAEEVEPLGSRGRLVRRTWPLDWRLHLHADPVPGPYGAVRLRIEVENISDWPEPSPNRSQALRRAMVAAHTLAMVEDGAFISLLDPPEWAKPAVAECVNLRTWPVLVGDPDRREVVLSSPIILYDYPVVAKESPGELFDGLEIDEILTLRTMALTDEEKRQARTTDPRASELIDRVDAMPPELLERLHGTVRYLRAVAGESSISDTEQPVDITARPDVPWWDPGADKSVSPVTDHVLVGGVPVAKGSRVRLRPGGRRSDAQDMFLVGRTATVRSVFLDVDGERYVAVTLDDDPGADLADAQGRYRYFSPEEIELLGDGHEQR